MPLTDVRIVDLPPMIVASALGFGRNPEQQASSRIARFARAKGLTLATPGPRSFGFNNPNPTPGSPNYGYERWITVGPEVEAEPPIEIKRVPPGKYAVTRCVGLENIGRRWQALTVWVEDSPYHVPPHGARCLEEFLDPEEPDSRKWVIDLYMEVVS
ncbi:MAG: effector binding domain-containing protein [Candidatus Bipolaricaulia bacterium]